MEDVEQRTRLARVLVAPPEMVFAELKAFSAGILSSRLSAADKDMEVALAARNDRLIDLGLACYGASCEIVGTMYRKALIETDDPTDALYRKGLRVGVLGNQTVAKAGFLRRFPTDTIGEEEVVRLLMEGGEPELNSLISNPAIDEDILLALYRGDGVASNLDEDRRRDLVAMSSRNDRLRECQDNMHGPDMRHYDLHKAIFAMVETVPTSKEWLWSVDMLLESLDPRDVRYPDSIDVVLERWKLDEKGQPEEPTDKDQYTDTGLTPREELRCLIAGLYGKSYAKRETVIHGTATDADPARRCAYYANASLKVSDIEAGYERDKDIFTFAALLNENVLTNKDLRKKFEEDCLRGDHMHRYNKRCLQIQKKWKWFDTRPVAEWLVDKTPPAEQSALERQVAQLVVASKRIDEFVKYAPWWIVGVGVVTYLASR
jgi:hypothetical protein